MSEETLSGNDSRKGSDKKPGTGHKGLNAEVGEIARTSHNLYNLINSMDIAMVLVDQSLQITFFTTAAGRLFNLTASDYGKPLSGIIRNVEYGYLISDAHAVMTASRPVEREITTIDGRIFTVRLLPAKVIDESVHGVVLTFADITRSKHTEESLRISESRMQAIIESAKDYAIFTIDTERRIKSWSRGAEEITGYSENEACGQSGDMIFTPEDRENGEPEKEIQKAMEHGYAEDERRHQRKDGRRFYGSGAVRPLRDGKDNLVGFVKILRDTTAAKLIEEGKYFLASIVESSQDSVVTINFDSIITTWNKSAEVLYGHPATDAIGKPLSIVTLPQDIKELFRKIDTIKHNQHVQIYDTIRLHKDGHLMNLEIALSPVKGPSGKVVGVSTIARNVTDRVKAEEALRASEQRFRAIIDQTTAGVCQFDLQGELTLVNRKLCAMLGYASHELIGKSIWELSYPEDVDKDKALYVQSKRVCLPLNLESRMVQKNGSILWVNRSLSFICDERGQAESAITVIIDITERKKLEEYKDEFIGVASHELKTPVTSIKAYAEILLERLENRAEERIMELARKLKNKIDRLSLLIAELLDTTKVANGKIELHIEPFDLNELIAASIEEVQQLTEKHNLIFHSTKINHVSADKHRIGQVLINLMTNAVKYSPNGGQVVVSAESDDRGVKVSVADEGIGIPEELTSKVFDRFFRVSNAKNVVQGMGLGLYISSAIIQLHGGIMSVESKPGAGSVFSFTIPHSR